MAKKRKQKEPEVAEEDVEVQLPEFDDEAFMKEEMRAGKVTFIAVGWGLVCGVLCFLVYLFTHDIWQISVVIGFILMAGIFGFLRLFKIDIQELNWKNYVGAAVSYLATWLIVFIILINVPVYDGQSPDIHYVRFYYDRDAAEGLNITEGDTLAGDVQYYMFVVITDNKKVDSVKLVITHEDSAVLPDTALVRVSGTDSELYNWSYKVKYNLSDDDYERFHDNLYEYKLPTDLAAGRYSYVITAEDPKGHKVTKEGSFYID